MTHEENVRISADFVRYGQPGIMATRSKRMKEITSYPLSAAADFVGVHLQYVKLFSHRSTLLTTAQMSLRPNPLPIDEAVGSNRSGAKPNQESCNRPAQTQPGELIRRSQQCNRLARRKDTRSSQRDVRGFLLELACCLGFRLAAHSWEG